MICCLCLQLHEVNYGQLGMFGEAKAAFASALKLDDECASIFTNLGSVAWEEGDLRRTLEVYERACELEPDPSEGAHLNRFTRDSPR